MKNIKNSFLPLLVITTLLLPTSSFAENSSVSLLAPTRTVAEGDTVLVPVLLNIPSVGINAFQARVAVSGAAHLVSISTGESVFTVWPEAPSITHDAATFIAGTPNSVTGSSLRAATLVITAATIGKVEVSVADATVYAGDGTGAPEPLNDSKISFMVGPKTGATVNELTDLLGKDLTPPNSFTITLGRDPSLYNNAYFISFVTSDTGSGVDRYEVSENDGPWVVATSPYLLSDQSLAGSVAVRAIDTAENVQTETLSFAASIWKIFAWVGVVLFVVVLCMFFLRRRRGAQY
jgi:hypothetical protein